MVWYWFCEFSSKGREGTFPLLPEVPGFQPLPSWGSPSTAQGLLGLPALQCWIWVGASARSLQIPYKSPVCRVIEGCELEGQQEVSWSNLPKVGPVRSSRSGAYPNRFWRSYFPDGLSLLTASSRSFIWLLRMPTSDHLQVKPLLLSAQGRGLRHFLQPPNQVAVSCLWSSVRVKASHVLGMPFSTSVGAWVLWHLMAGFKKSHAACSSPWPHWHAGYPVVNYWSRYVKCIILCIVLAFAFWKSYHYQNSAEFHEGTNLSLGMVIFHTTCNSMFFQ